jgi:hypothetical protein
MVSSDIETEIQPSSIEKIPFAAVAYLTALRRGLPKVWIRTLAHCLKLALRCLGATVL